MSREHEASGFQASRNGSTVLARMIQRTREPRPSLEPVIRPLFAPPADGFAPGPDPVPPPDLVVPDALAPDALAPDAVLPEVLALDAFPPPNPRPPDSGPPDGRAPEAPSPGVLLPEAPDAVMSTPSSRRHPRAGQARAADGDTGAPAAHVFPSSAVGIAPADGPVSGHAPAPLDLVPLFRREYVLEQRSHQSAAPAARVSADQEGARGPAVTITIGHIEVRAAAPAPRPPRPAAPPRPRPAFRPQTTLADFLADGRGRLGGSGRP
jgi:nicotinate-nucleotide--dimethylbenzimidazole phosphoribosyltransferase